MTALASGDYVVISPDWQSNGNVVGAVTWGNGGAGTVGPLSAANSFVGSTDGDHVGSGGVTALINGNYVVSSPNWQISNYGAVLLPGATASAARSVPSPRATAWWARSIKAVLPALA